MIAEKKFVMMFKGPRGKTYFAGVVDGKFALIPNGLQPPGSNIFLWDNKNDMTSDLRRIRDHVGDEEYARLWQMKPTVGTIDVSGSTTSFQPFRQEDFPKQS